ncbi:hypothetical protein ACELLULO517_06435 [Acidisoma cellulosilytica]|uniref:Alpha/beta hydrolase n=1 Tax=Acidisoma cellulosilyticum TaxID=2802395 RepID=A0A963YZQ6_9PROT|nr:hypothetical protein [Acidisoma cellulosilyticum]MCB8879864.1 hypothetical protein [Acidisoma cellulosilyticum]
MEQSKIIYTNRSFEVHFRPGKSAFCLITFNPLETRSNGRFYWGRPLAEKWDYTCLGFVTHGNDWFPESDMLEAAEVLKPYLNGRNVLYGFSMGAYAAVRYSKLLNAELVLAFSPLLSIDPQDVPHDSRWHKLHRPELHSNMRVREEHVQGDLLVFYDPLLPSDAWHGQEISGYPQGVALPLPFTGHETLAVAMQFPGFSGIINRCVYDRDSLADYMKAGRRRSSMFHFLAAAKMAERGKYRWSIALLDKADELGGAEASDHDALRLKIYALSKQDEDAEVLLSTMARPGDMETRAWRTWADAADIFGERSLFALCDRLYEAILKTPSLLFYERYITCLQNRGDYCRIAMLVAAAIAAFPEDVRIPIKAGDAFLQGSQEVCAILMYEIVITRQPSLTWPHHALFRIYNSRNDLVMINRILRRTLDFQINDDATKGYRKRFGVE